MKFSNVQAMMPRLLGAAVLFTAFGLAVPHSAKAQSTKPEITATCKDGTTYTGTSKRAACKKNGGVESFGTATPAAAGAPAATPMASTTASTSAPKPMTTATGGGPGQVWVNAKSKIYHCPGDRYYGKTKNGTYVTESAAVSAGDKPSGGKACK